jgi:hypothetical protein
MTISFSSGAACLVVVACAMPSLMKRVNLLAEQKQARAEESEEEGRVKASEVGQRRLTP